MAILDRARTALVFALLVTAAQAACLVVLALAGLLPGPEEMTRPHRKNPGPFLQVGSFVALLVAPVLVHNRLEGHRWAPVASRQATIVCSLIGLLFGYLLGGVLAENGFAPSWTLGTRAGALLGSFAAVFLSNVDLMG